MATETLIKASQVRIGVYVRIPLPWMNSSFLLKQFLVRTESQVKAIADLGMDVFCIHDKCVAEPKPSPVVAVELTLEQEASLHAMNEQRERAATIKRERAAVMNAIRGRLSATQKSFAAAAELTSAAFTRFGSNPREGFRVLAGIADESVKTSLADSDTAIMVIVGQTAQGADGSHALSVMTLSLLLARYAGETDETLKAIATGALVHDIHLSRMDRSIVRKVGRTRHEQASFESHCKLGVAEVGLAGLASPQVRDIVLQHHEREDGKGYPSSLRGASISRAAKIVAMADRFDELTNPLEMRLPHSPFEALSVMFTTERSSFDEELLQQFICAMGVYPPGTLVQLSDGHTGLVVAAAPASSRLCPQVLLYEPGVPKSEATIIDLATKPGNPDGITVVKALRTQDRSEDELDYLLPRRKLAWFRAPA